MSLQARALIAMLDKDEESIPTKEALRKLMRQIDDGVKQSGWGKTKRAELMKRIHEAASWCGFHIVNTS